MRCTVNVSSTKNSWLILGNNYVKKAMWLKVVDVRNSLFYHLKWKLLTYIQMNILMDIVLLRNILKSTFKKTFIWVLSYIFFLGFHSSDKTLFISVLCRSVTKSIHTNCMSQRPQILCAYSWIPHIIQQIINLWKNLSF